MLGDELKDGHQPTMVEEEEGDQSKVENTVKEWEKERTNLRRVHKIRGAINMERGLVLSPSRKRGGDHTTTIQTSTTSPPTNSNKKKRKPRLKYPVMELDWGLSLEQPPTPTQIEGRSPPPPTPTIPQTGSDPSTNNPATTTTPETNPPTLTTLKSGIHRSNQHHPHPTTTPITTPNVLSLKIPTLPHKPQPTPHPEEAQPPPKQNE